MKKHPPILTLIFLLFTSCYYSEAIKHSSSKTIDAKFVGAWVSTNVQTVNGHKVILADTSVDFLKHGYLIIIKKNNADENSYLVQYGISVFVDEIYKVEDDNTLLYTMKPDFNFDNRIRYDGQTGHIIYSLNDDSASNTEFIKLND